MKEVITDAAAAAAAQHPKLFPSAQSRVAVRACVRLEGKGCIVLPKVAAASPSLSQSFSEANEDRHAIQGQRSLTRSLHHFPRIRRMSELGVE